HDAAALFAGLVGAFPMPPALGFMFGIKAEVHQRVVALAGFHDHIAAASTIAAGGPAPRDKFLTAKGHAAVAAVAGLDPNSCFVYEHENRFPSIAVIICGTLLPVWHGRLARGH